MRLLHPGCFVGVSSPSYSCPCADLPCTPPSPQIPILTRLGLHLQLPLPTPPTLSHRLARQGDGILTPPYGPVDPLHAAAATEEHERTRRDKHDLILHPGGKVEQAQYLP